MTIGDTVRINVGDYKSGFIVDCFADEYPNIWIVEVGEDQNGTIEEAYAEEELVVLVI